VKCSACTAATKVPVDASITHRAGNKVWFVSTGYDALKRPGSSSAVTHPSSREVRV
jgi:hypothetical protein